MTTASASYAVPQVKAKAVKRILPIRSLPGCWPRVLRLPAASGGGEPGPSVHQFSSLAGLDRFADYKESPIL